jgi:hypothetical protein
LFLEILPYVDNGRVKKFLKFVVAPSFMAHGSYQKPVGSNKQCLSPQLPQFFFVFILFLLLLLHIFIIPEERIVF